MEDSPRIKGEEADSEGTTLKPGEDSPKRRSTQDFLDRWKQFSSRSSERSVDDDNEDEDDDETTDSESSVSAASKKRFRRLRKRLQPFLPQMQEVSSSKEDPVSDYAEQPLSDQNTPFSIEDILGSVSREIENDSTILESGDSSSETTDSIERLTDVDIKEESGPQAEDATAIVPETESIEDILQRRDHDLGRGDRGVVEYNRTPTVEQTNATDQLRTADTHERVSPTAPVGSLLAVDLLNYGVAKRRDNKNRVVNERQHQEMKKEQKANNTALKNEIMMSKKHHNELRKEVAIDREDAKVHLRDTNNEVIYNRSAGSDSLKVIKKPEYISVPPTTTEKASVATDSKKAEQLPEQRSNESFENTLQRVAVAENGRISSEFQFERRHEVKDTPGDRSSGLQNASGQAIASGDDRSPMTGMETLDGRLLDMSAKSSAREVKEPVYKQAAITGFWGAVAGIVVFIILYMLASR